MEIIVISILFLIFLAALILKCYEGDIRALWRLSIISSVILFAGIISAGYIILKFHSSKEHNSIIVADRATMNEVINDYRRKCIERYIESPLFIPTGFFLQSFEFLTSYNVELTGYVWQKYYSGVHDNISRGIVMPEAISFEINPVYHHNYKDYELIGWYFKAVLRQNFDFSKYPLDHKNVWIRLWHKDFEKNIVLVPDINSYKMINPSSLPGLEEDFVLPGWSIESSFFNYKNASYNTNFGIKDYIGQEHFPELYYTIIIERDITDAFLSSLIPLFIIVCILFAILLTLTNDKDKKELFGFSTTEVIGICTALLFSVIVSHHTIRTSIQIKGVIYIDYFHFSIYFLILMVAVNAFIFTSNKNIKFVQFNDNLIPKLLYWPFSMGMFFMITIITFF